jgi:hypothetical protein
LQQLKARSLYLAGGAIFQCELVSAQSKVEIIRVPLKAVKTLIRTFSCSDGYPLPSKVLVLQNGFSATMQNCVQRRHNNHFTIVPE